MLRIFFVVLIILAAAFLIKTLVNNPQVQSGFVHNSNENVSISHKSIFVPYWSLDSDKSVEDYDTLIYFGVAADESGLISDPGTENVSAFLAKSTPQQKKLLTLRLVDHETNTQLLDNPQAQKRIITQAIDFAKTNGFDGIVIDFETKSLGFQEVTNKTTSFLTNSLKMIKDNGLEAHTLLFGDTYYRARAFDVEKISNASDSIMVMTYDFHKSGGNPGPTYPTSNKREYGYDLESMIKDFKNDVPKEKLSIIIGMFGYDWPINSDGISIGPGTPLTSGEAEMLYLSSCPENNCKVTIDNDAQTKITYKDSEETNHEVWVETIESSNKKIELLEKNGISSIGYWAYTFF